MGVINLAKYLTENLHTRIVKYRREIIRQTQKLVAFMLFVMIITAFELQLRG